MKLFNLSLTLLIFSSTCYSQTNISGSVFSSTTWTISGSPYIVSGNVVVFAGVDLTIDPGVAVRFNAGAGIELRGTLIAIGAPGDSIEFTSNNVSPTIGSWNGITVLGTTNPLGVGDQVTMEYVKGSYANVFINLDLAYHGPYVFRHCYFSNNNKVNEDGGMPSTIFEYCTFESNNLGLDWCQFYSRVSNSSFINNVNGVIGIANIDTCYFAGNTGTALEPYGSTVGCTIENNNIGVNGVFNSANDTFINNTVSNNAVGVEIYSYFNGSITFIGNTICDNTSYNVKLLHINNADLSFNCWCSTDSAYIRSKIFDGYVDNAYGLVEYSPIEIDCSQITVGLDEMSELSFISTIIYPNPIENIIHILLENSIDAYIELLDNTGKLILSKKAKDHNTPIDMSEHASGIYFIKVRNNANTITRKVIKK